MVLVAVAGVVVSGACARQGAPPGGPQDRRPPVVVATEPDTYAVVEDFDGPVRFRFDERVSERVAGGDLSGAVLVSPRTGAVRVDHGRGGLEVSLAGGFEPGVVYRVTLLPVVSDLFGNQMRDPFELVFSTGAELVPSAIAGIAWDRITGRGVEGLQVLAMHTRDSTEYVARADTAGIYAFRYLPPGSYNIWAFQDRDADGEVDDMEVQGQRFLTLTGADTLVAEIGVLQPDTTPAVLTAAEVLDSLTLSLRFDEPLAPLNPIEPGNVGLTALARDDSVAVLRDDEGEVVLDEDAPAPEVARVFHEHEYRSWVRVATDSLARLDSLDRAEARRLRQAGDTLAARELVEGLPRPGPVPLAGGGAGPGAGRGEGGAQGPARGPDGRPLPSQEVIVRLAGPLVLNRGYQATATGINNLSQLPLGGGTAVVVRTPPPEPADSLAADSPAADSLAADSPALDSLAPRPDSLAPPPDSLALDSLAPRPDSLAPPPDTLRAVHRGPWPSLSDGRGTATTPPGS